jgi:GDP-L-fucose synthase
MDKQAKIYVSGHSGLVGSALVKELQAQGFTNLVLKARQELDLLDAKATAEFFDAEKPDYVFHLAAKVGGIVGNKTYPADFIYENITVQNNVIYNAHRVGVKKLLFFGSVCIYPREAAIPIKEVSLLTGPLEQTNEAYAIAKIAGLMMCKKYKEQYGDNFISVMPANLFGINDNFHTKNGHVIPMLLRRFHEAKINNAPEVVVWGTGKPTRDFLFADDLASGLIHLMQHYDGVEHINIGPGQETSIAELVELIKEVVGYEGNIVFDIEKPDGTPRRYLETSKITALGWSPKHTLKEALQKTYEWFVPVYERGELREL